MESRPYNAATTEQKFITAEEFLVLYNGGVHKVKKPKELPVILSDGKSELDDFLKSSAMKGASSAEQMAAIIRFYNSLD